MDRTRQVEIIHLSDLHFGNEHRFDPLPAIRGDIPTREGYPSLCEMLHRDLQGHDPGCPVIVCITGDFATCGAFEEFETAEKFIRDLISEPILGMKRDLNSVFIVPGNHDIKFDSANIGERWQQWADFYNRLYQTRIQRDRPLDTVYIHDRVRDLGVLILQLNSCVYVQRNRPDEDRGNIDLKQLSDVEAALRTISPDRLESSVRIALIHHHPVLIPALAEPGRGYDAIQNSGKLLTILRRYGFHLLLHGHKHNPHVFTDDHHSAFTTAIEQPILVISGGSAGSRALPDLPRRCNCYNRITVKWHPRAQQTRIKTVTRGLEIFDDYGTEKLPSEWKWQTIGNDDRRLFLSDKCFPDVKFGCLINYDKKIIGENERLRVREYERSRGNMPVVEVMPSLTPDQAYEARLWIVPHNRNTEDIPVEVLWSAGKNFPIVKIRREEDPNFCTSLSYWGPMLVQALLKFEDGESEAVHVYARLPDSIEQQ